MTQGYNSNEAFLQALEDWGHKVFELLLAIQHLSATEQVATPEHDATNPLLQQIKNQSTQHSQLMVRTCVAELQSLEQQMEQQLADSYQQQVFIPFIHVRQLFGLSELEQQLLLLMLLPEISNQWTKIFSTIADKYQIPAADKQWHHRLLLAYLSCRQYRDGTLNHCLFDSSTLMHWKLLRATASGDEEQSYRLDPILRDYLLGHAAPQLYFMQALKILTVSDGPSFVAKNDEQQLTDLANYCSQNTERSLLLNFQGTDPLQLNQIAANWLAQFSMRLAVLDSKLIVQQFQRVNKDSRALHSQFLRLLRDALLCNFCLLIENSQVISSDNETKDVLWALLDEVVKNFRFVVMINASQTFLSQWALQQPYALSAVNLAISPPDLSTREQIWRYYSEQRQLPVNETHIQQLASSYLFDHSQILQTIQRYQNRMIISRDSPWDNLLESCRLQTERDLNNIARLVRTRFRLKDIVLPERTMAQLQEVLNYAMYRHQVIEQWGFNKKSEHSKNLCALFHGPSGTGKTMAASVIANELHQSLYRIDLSSVMSKYIGETEKNLAQLFDQAEAMNVILFFDEAESLFGKRTESKDSHDRYANLQTGYLLQRIENYQGIVILSTNLLKNIDTAFNRRFKFIVEYPFPDTQQRLQLWRSAFPQDVPLASDIDLQLMAARLPMTGGSINNIAIKAAFFAAAEQRDLGMPQLLRATEQEYQKLGKVFTPEEYTWEEEDDLW